jgi:5-methyltetrahydrofolate--homocysteine methyltransferase
MVGGAAVTKEFAETIGADGWAPDAGSAVILAKRLVAEARAAAAGEPAPVG